jgi:hypothetical protein
VLLRHILSSQNLKKPSIKGLIAQAVVIATTLPYIIGGILIFAYAIFAGVLRVEDISMQGLVLAMSARGEDPSLIVLTIMIWLAVALWLDRAIRINW